MLYKKQTKLHGISLMLRLFSFHSRMFLFREHDIQLFYLSKIWMSHNWLQLNALLADSEREKLVKKLSHANQQNRLLKRQVQRHMIFLCYKYVKKVFTFHNRFMLIFLLLFSLVIVFYVYNIFYCSGCFRYMVQINLKTWIKILKVNLCLRYKKKKQTK